MVALGTYAMTFFVLGFGDVLGEILDAGRDEASFSTPRACPSGYGRPRRRDRCETTIRVHIGDEAHLAGTLR